MALLVALLGLQTLVVQLPEILQVEILKIHLVALAPRHQRQVHSIQQEALVRQVCLYHDQELELVELDQVRQVRLPLTLRKDRRVEGHQLNKIQYVCLERWSDLGCAFPPSQRGRVEYFRELIALLLLVFASRGGTLQCRQVLSSYAKFIRRHHGTSQEGVLYQMPAFVLSFDVHL